MKLPLAQEGAREISIAVVASAAWAGLWLWLGVPAAAAVVLLPLAAVLMFFRDPPRKVPAGADLIVSAADGRVTHVHRVEKDPIIGGPAMRISVFLSVADVHVNRAPCAGTVLGTQLREGLYLDARHEDCADKNACNTLTFSPDRPIKGPLVVKQLTGKIARRIVCNVRAGDRLGAGEKFGMIKFGSRTDVIIPEQPGLDVLARVGQTVRAGTTVLARVVQPQATSQPAESSRVEAV